MQILLYYLNKTNEICDIVYNDHVNSVMDFILLKNYDQEYWNKKSNAFVVIEESVNEQRSISIWF